MKKTLIVALFFGFLFSSCEGDPGPQGPPGQDGGLIVSSAFEIVIDFNQANNYQFIEAYGFDVFPTDVTLVYILWDTVNGQDVWRLLPQSVTFDDATELVYNFDFTQQDVAFFLDGTADFDTLDPVWTQDQVFRVVVIPADNVGVIDVSNLDVLMTLGGIENFELR